MSTYKDVHAFEAVSSAARIEKNNPNASCLNFELSDGSYIDLLLTRSRLELLQNQIDAALKATPLPPRRQ
jgi:hypothetical protein